MIFAAVLTYPTSVSCSTAPSTAPPSLPLPTPVSIAPAPGPAPAVCQYLSASVSICGGTALATPAAAVSACLANATGAAASSVNIYSLTAADSLPCGPDGRPVMGCYGQNASTDTSGTRSVLLLPCCFAVHAVGESVNLYVVLLCHHCISAEVLTYFSQS